MPAAAGGGLEGRLRLVPDLVRADALGGPVGELDAHVLEAEVPVDIEDQPRDGDRTPR